MWTPPSCLKHCQLWAILFTDIEGYTAIMQESEQAAMTQAAPALLDNSRRAQEFSMGIIIRYYGHGMLTTFQIGIIEAVQCALSMQQQFLQARCPVRMGLHVGNRSSLRKKILLGTVSTLPREIESLGVSGCVFISDKANDELHTHSFP